MIIRTQTRDPAWPISIQSRTAVLWIGPSWRQFIAQGDAISRLERIVLQTWAAVFVDASDTALPTLTPRATTPHELVVRHYEENPDAEQLPPNRLPIYYLRGPRGTAGPGAIADPRGMLNRLKMLERIPPACDVFAIGVEEAGDVAGLIEAQAVSSQVRRFIVAATHELSLELLASGDIVAVQWTTDCAGVERLLEDVACLAIDTAGATILVRTPAGTRTVDLASCVDASHPITRSFELIPAREILTEREPSLQRVDAFFANPAASWAPYALGIPQPRQKPYEDALLRSLGHFRREGPAASFTAWIAAEDGSGATTTLRQLCFNIAREGIPLLVAKQGIERFDFRQIAAFLSAAVARMSDAGVATAETPWLVVFDAAHAQLHWDFVASLCNGLKKLLRSVVVLAIRPQSAQHNELRQRALGINKMLASALRNTLSNEEAIALGQHLSRFLPPSMLRSPSEWASFCENTIQTTLEGRRSLFWLALRFWLFRVPGTEQSMRSWLASKLRAATGGDQALTTGLLETASLARYRLAMPLPLSPESSRQRMTAFAADSQNALGFRALQYGPQLAYTFAHPLIAEELLRIAAGDHELLAAAGKMECLNLADLELHLLARLVSRPSAGSRGCIEVIEELVTSALRVDPREAPANYDVRDRIVTLLEGAPDSLFDVSQIFNHHLAKARRHLALDPPDSRWTLDARVEQLQLAENHLIDALYNIRPEDDNRREAPLNLWVSLALTYDARSRLETVAERREAAREYESKAAEAFLAAQKLDADNCYVLENYARFLLRRAKPLEAGPERTRLIVDAIALLEWEQLVDEGAQRAEPVFTELAAAYDLLNDGAGRAFLLDPVAKGSEIALVALAQLALRRDDQAPATSDALAEAERLLTQVNPATATWRSHFALYRVVSRSRPLDFAQRLDLLKQLESAPDFAWPQQLRLEYGILLFQMGDHRKGRDVFQRLREELRERSGWLAVPREMKFLADPASHFQKPLRTVVIVKNVSNVGRSFFGIPTGWGNVEIVIRPFLFGRDVIRVRNELDCLIQFTNFGPQAVPPTVAQ